MIVNPFDQLIDSRRLWLRVKASLALARLPVSARRCMKRETDETYDGSPRDLMTHADVAAVEGLERCRKRRGRRRELHT